MLVATIPAFTNVCSCSFRSPESCIEERIEVLFIPSSPENYLFHWVSVVYARKIWFVRAVTPSWRRTGNFVIARLSNLSFRFIKSLNSDSQRRLRGVEFHDEKYPSNQCCFYGILVDLFILCNFLAIYNAVYIINIMCYCKLQMMVYFLF